MGAAASGTGSACRRSHPVSYGAVMEVMGLLNGAGYRKIGLVTGNSEDPVNETAPN